MNSWKRSYPPRSAGGPSAVRTAFPLPRLPCRRLATTRSEPSNWRSSGLATVRGASWARRRIDSTWSDAIRIRVRLVEGDDPLWKGVGRAPVQDQWWRFRRWNLAGISHHMHPGALARHFADVLGQ